MTKPRNADHRARDQNLSQAERIDQVCTAFEADWKTGETPRLEDWLRNLPGADRPALLKELVLLETHYRRRRGEAVGAGQYRQRFPELEDAWLEEAVASPHERTLEMTRSVVRSQSSVAEDPLPRRATDYGLRTTDSEAEQPERIGRYRLERVLGQGAFGIVYLAHDEQLERKVAIKVPDRRFVSRPEDAQAYLREARTVANLDHPSIVPVYDVGSTEDCSCFIVSKFIEGCTLTQKINEDRPSVLEAAELVATVAEALHYAHHKRLVHRDIKPGNILLDTSGKPFVVDFGLALKEENVGQGPKYAGTPAYMSPEQARGEGHRVDGRSDIFSLGVVFYELLTGRRPFQADSWDQLPEQITSMEVRPPRQWDDTIPKEVERICLKALSKRATERYTTAKDMGEDLRQWSVVRSQSSVAEDPVPRRATDYGLRTTDSEKPLTILPKGLRSFDEHDRDFFLQLLPGARDREGLPDSIRFWKNRIEETDPDNTFPVGLIYGPSGCGKSSLVKAGLLPRLSDDVIAVYVEATADETETRLLNGLRKRCPALPAHLGLKKTLAALRRGQGIREPEKVLIVLDQFEQWLHAKKDEENTELVQALRQCDGGRVQCIILVRDDFWLAVSRFLRELETRLVEGQNSALADLFDVDHGKKVLAAFGRAFGKLPENPGVTSKEQKEFLNQAIQGLAQEGKVICVRLALFTDMMKGKPWTPSTLKAVGGTEGVGVTFLEEAFSAATAPPEHRYHQKAARAVLKALLPESVGRIGNPSYVGRIGNPSYGIGKDGTDIKGHLRSHAELLEASGYGGGKDAGRLRDFDDLIRILDSETRLIAPTDPEGKDGADESTFQAQPGEKYYQLTHDYLVPSVRDWLTRKQKETRRGRAELRLAERASAWNAKPESRHLPAWWEWLNIGLFTRKRDWTEPQRKMMRHAGRYHAVRGLALAVLLVALTLAGLGVRGQVVEQNRATHAAGLVRQLLRAETAQLPDILKELQGYRTGADPLLRQEQEQAEEGSSEKLHTSLALLPVDEGQADYLYRRLLDAEPTQLSVIRDALAGRQGALTEKLWAVVEGPQKGKESRGLRHRRLRAAAALAVYDPDSPRWDSAQGAVAADLVTVPAVHLANWVEALRPVRNRLLAPLSAVFRDGKRRETERSLATDILADYAARRPGVLAELLMDADEKQFAVLFPKVLPHRGRAVSVLSETVKTPLEAIMTDEDRETLAKRQANAAVALLRLGQAGQAWPLLRHRPDPRVRSYLIHRLALLGADPGAIVRQLEDEKEVSIRRALLLALGEFGLDRLPDDDRERLVPVVLRQYREDADAGLHGAAEWLLRQWKQGSRLKEFERAWMKDGPKQEQRLGQIRRELAKAAGRGEGYWYVNGQGQTMVVVPGPVTFRMGSPATEAGRAGGPKGNEEMLHQKRIGRTFAIAAYEVTVAQFRSFREDYDYNKTVSPSHDCPVNVVTWYDAAAYCNWLSKVEGIAEEQRCYEPNKEGKYAEGMKLKANYLQLEGYRLPSEAEWEYACRAGSATSRYYGETEELLGRYGWYTKVSQDRWMLPAGSLKPNDLGLFDMLGNALEWCQERVVPYAPGLLQSEDKEDMRDIDSRTSRVLRGGSFVLPTVYVRSANRQGLVPTHRGLNVGFRPARTFR
jgi:serine/threonine protein kinase/formylglycine-generating enzyme required for sulfatase activity